ncbi:MAG: LytTR family transcriptional regulator DNA-binding domain-containing protein [Oscillospiraceae bacterium]|nr:LytTR family transcriptional regulator DNA-binding domain-containing protein [Oscillospiraceae bacterium]
MRQKDVAALIDLMRECLEHYWQLDYEFLLRLCSPAVIGVEELRGKVVQGYDAVAEDMRQISQQLRPCHVIRQEYLVSMKQRNSCLIVGYYFISPDTEGDVRFQTEQRCSFGWALTDGKPWIHHIHISNPVNKLQDDVKNMLMDAARAADGRRLPYRKGERNACERLHFRGRGGTIYLLAPYEILYILSQNHDCTVHLLDGSSCQGRMRICDLMPALSDNFVRIHNSVIVNRNYVTMVKRFCVIMEDGAELPIPVKRFTEIKSLLLPSE